MRKTKRFIQDYIETMKEMVLNPKYKWYFKDTFVILKYLCGGILLAIIVMRPFEKHQNIMVIALGIYSFALSIIWLKIVDRINEKYGGRDNE